LVYSRRGINKGDKNKFFSFLSFELFFLLDKITKGRTKFKKKLKIIYLMLLPVGCIKISCLYGSKSHGLVTLFGAFSFVKGLEIIVERNITSTR
jgi:hypothetical protein